MSFLSFLAMPFKAWTRAEQDAWADDFLCSVKSMKIDQISYLKKIQWHPGCEPFYRFNKLVWVEVGVVFDGGAKYTCYYFPEIVSESQILVDLERVSFVSCTV
jgi:hypothetical protein